MFWSQFVVASLLLPLASSRNYCPVTSRYNASQNGYLALPSLYWPDQINPEGGEEFYNCSIRPKWGPLEIGACMSQRPCVVSPEEVMVALEQQTWTPSMNAICSLEEQINRGRTNGGKQQFPRHSINLIIIGGSMTHGSVTEGLCVCSQEEDSRCAEIDRSKLPETFCSWTTHFVNWLAAEFPMIQFNVSDLSQSGLASIIVPDTVGPFFHRLSFSDNDIIIIDESVNDADRIFADLKQDVESMFRRLYAATRGSFPTIIMIEQYPHRGYSDGYHHRASYNNRVLPGDYAIVYRNLSQHYGFVYYSMREVYWSFFNENITKAHRYPFTPFHDWHFNGHPPWYFHNFMADVVADCFLFSLSRCRHLRGSQTSAFLPRYVLPPPYYTLSTEEYCDPSKPYLLDAHPMNHFHPENLKEFEEGSDAKHAGWREYADHHNTSGWIINDLSDPAKREISFPLEAEVQVVDVFSNLRIVVLFLRSYEGMGVAELLVCGHPDPLVLDGLYKDFRTNRVSIPTMASTLLNDGQITACKNLPAKERAIVIRYTPERPTENNEVRHHKKVKILSVEVCSKAVNK
jgi:hypothetical protein